MKTINISDVNELRRSKEFIESVVRGLSDSEKGEVFSTAKVKAILKKGLLRRNKFCLTRK